MPKKSSENLKDNVKRYIEKGKLYKLKSFVNKANFHPSMSLDIKGRTALHLACHWQQLDVVVFLLQQGSDPLIKDSNGNIALHTALKAKIKRKKVFRRIIKILLRLYPESLHIRNLKGKTCKSYLDDLKIYTTFDHLPRNETNREESAWTSRLQEEADFEYFENWGNYEQDYNIPERESYDEWANRIYREFNQKRQNLNTNAPSTSQQKSRSEKSHRWNDSDQAKFDERCQEEEKRRLAKAERRLSKKRKKQYEELCQFIFEEETAIIHPADIPEEEDLVMVLKSTEDLEGDIKKYLREQQIKWHPDKFLQKCRHKIIEQEKDEIMTRVNKISQAINSHLQKNS